MSDIQRLAMQFGVSETDLKSFAQAVINGMKADSVDDAYLAMSEKRQRETVEAYATHAVRKMEQFVGTYHTNPEAAEDFRRTVRGILQREWLDPATMPRYD